MFFRGIFCYFSCCFSVEINISCSYTTRNIGGSVVFLLSVLGVFYTYLYFFIDG